MHWAVRGTLLLVLALLSQKPPPAAASSSSAGSQWLATPPRQIDQGSLSATVIAAGAVLAAAVLILVLAGCAQSWSAVERGIGTTTAAQQHPVRERASQGVQEPGGAHRQAISAAGPAPAGQQELSPFPVHMVLSAVPARVAHNSGISGDSTSAASSSALLASGTAAPGQPANAVGDALARPPSYPVASLPPQKAVASAAYESDDEGCSTAEERLHAINNSFRTHARQVSPHRMRLDVAACMAAANQAAAQRAANEDGAPRSARQQPGAAAAAPPSGGVAAAAAAAAAAADDRAGSSADVEPMPAPAQLAVGVCSQQCQWLDAVIPQPQPLGHNARTPSLTGTTAVKQGSVTSGSDGQGNGAAHGCGQGSGGRGSASQGQASEGQGSGSAATSSLEGKSTGAVGSNIDRQPPYGSLACRAPNIGPIDLEVDLTKGELKVDYSARGLLGQGGFAAVYKGRFRGHRVAVKMIKKATGTNLVDLQEDINALIHELNILRQVNHPNIVTLYGGCLKPPHIFLVEERMEGTLDFYIHTVRKHDPLTVREMVYFALDIACGLSYLHPRIVHRDLKLANVLLTREGRCKISDFGLARTKLKEYLSTKNLDAGTTAYIAPECFMSMDNPEVADLRRSVTDKTDIYALGVMMWEMAAGKRPWQGLKPLLVAYQVAYRSLRPPLFELGPRCPPKLRQLVEDCWCQEPKRRPSSQQVLERLLDILNDLPSEGPAAMQKLGGEPDPHSQPGTAGEREAEGERAVLLFQQALMSSMPPLVMTPMLAAPPPHMMLEAPEALHQPPEAPALPLSGGPAPRLLGHLGHLMLPNDPAPAKGPVQGTEPANRA